jgi:hypothetical protein
MNHNFITMLREVALRSNTMADQGHHVFLDVVYDEIEKGTIIEWLVERGSGITGPVTDKESPERNHVINTLQSVAKHIRHREMSQLGIENNGYCLITALTLEIMANHL